MQTNVPQVKPIKWRKEMRLVRVAPSCLVALLSAAANAQAGGQPATDPAIAAQMEAAVARVAEAAAAEAVEKSARREFAGLSFGVGLSLTADTDSTQRVKSASIVDGVVRVDADENREARIMLESHYFFIPEKKPFIGWGPYVALQPGTDEVIDALGLGMMVGFRRRAADGSASNDDSWNIGLGYVVDPHVNVLGDGFTANQAPPGTETSVRLKDTSQEGWFLIFSFSF